MTLAYDRITPIPVMHIYDTGMMQTAIAAAKDTYETAQKQLDEFTNKYSDFMSPFAKDMERYGQMVNGVQEAIDTMYANGIDPLRSAEGRMMLRRIKNSIDPGEFNRMRVNAKMGFEYLQDLEKAKAAGDFDEDYENWRLQNGGPGLFNEFSSANGAMWNTPAVGRYKDLNNWTHHLFDNMELSYDPELSKQYPGFMAYTKNRDTMNTIVSNNIAELLKTDLGKYQLAQLQAKGLDYDEAVKELQKRIVDSNWEEGQIKLEKDPYYFADYENKLQQKLYNIRYNNGGGGGRGGNSSGGYEYNYLTGVFQRGISIPFGYDPATQGLDAIKNITANQMSFGRSTIPNGNPKVHKWEAYKSKSSAYLNQFTLYESPDMFSHAISRPTVNKMGGVFLTPNDIQKIHTSADIVTDTYGYPNQRITTDRSKLPNPITKMMDPSDPENTTVTNVIMIPYMDVYTAYRKGSKSIESQWKVKLVNAQDGTDYGDYWYDLPIQSEPNAEAPAINEWTYSTKTGKSYAPKDSKGNERGQAKTGVNAKISGVYERSSQQTNKAMGVSKNVFSGNVPYTPESISQ